MRCGIMTFSNIPNFGAVLQAYSLCRTIRGMGIDCEIIDYTCENIVKRELIMPAASNPIKNAARMYIQKKYRVPRTEKCCQFTQSRGMMSRIKYDKNNIVKANDEYDVFISGSDMIWDRSITDSDNAYFLQFAGNDKKRTAYGSSVGHEFSDSDSEIFDLLKKYSMIGVRESNINSIINKHGISSSLVCDPTMLITANEWDVMCGPVRERDYVIVYFPYEEILDAAYRYAKKHRRKLLVISDVNKHITKYKCVHIADPAEWLSYIRNADAVFTDSYHGILFSMYFNKIFFTNKNDNRAETILNKFQLNDRYIKNNAELTEEIDYTRVNAQAEAFRNESLMFLKKALSD